MLVACSHRPVNEAPCWTCSAKTAAAPASVQTSRWIIVCNANMQRDSKCWCCPQASVRILVDTPSHSWQRAHRTNTAHVLATYTKQQSGRRIQYTKWGSWTSSGVGMCCITLSLVYVMCDRTCVLCPTAYLWAQAYVKTLEPIKQFQDRRWLLKNKNIYIAKLHFKGKDALRCSTGWTAL